MLQPHRQLLVGGRREPLGKRALDVLSVLAEAQGAIVTKDELLEAVWPGIVVEENALQVHMVAVRKALGPEAHRLKTIRSIGYELELDASGFAAKSNVVPVPHEPRLGQHEHRIPVILRTLAASGSSDQTGAALANGITDELIVRLRRMPELRIGTADPEGKVGTNVFENAYIIDGTLRSNGDRLRVAARLSSSKGEILWSQTFDHRLVDLFDVQEQIAASIADALSVSFDVGANSAEYGGTDDPEAFAAYLQFRVHQLHPDQAVPMRYLERAISIDPAYIKALGAMSTSYGIRAAHAVSRKQALELLLEQDKSTQRAVAANPSLWVGHVARGWYYNNRRDFRSCEKSMQLAAQLDKGNDPELPKLLALYSFSVGRTKKGLAFLDSAALIDPIYRHDPALVWGLLQSEQYDEAVELYGRLAASEPGRHLAFASYAFWAQLCLGDERTAIQFARQQGIGTGDDLLAFKADETLLAMPSAKVKQWATSQYGDGGHFQLVNAALYAGYCKHPELAMNLMQLALDRPGNYAVSTFWNPAMAEARKTDAFGRLVTELGLETLWRESGDWGDFCQPRAAGIQTK
ncbi:winged helix-turn-helix domain-containing protein [Croceibacterium sp. LX-88]|uniref:Winged helix-turn-helix domain-containing protein n=1 Tax=Croceibacterium selenioxidans TaxID=2838833 RepID=A0ABS5W5R8_9SPHN|nr:winged helix-turn-helix domain-containing protein [Croceibacterium selenioxidans]MBT2134677.1 winged helix-turn-helix domain-containing protein [Croceibacterium selenioxidans]